MKWKIERTSENFVIINLWLNQINGPGYTSGTGWAYSEKVNATYAHTDTNGKPKDHDSFTTITIEEFRAIISGKPIGANFLIYN